MRVLQCERMSELGYSMKDFLDEFQQATVIDRAVNPDIDLKAVFTAVAGALRQTGLIAASEVVKDYAAKIDNDHNVLHAKADVQEFRYPDETPYLSRCCGCELDHCQYCSAN